MPEQIRYRTPRKAELFLFRLQTKTKLVKLQSEIANALIGESAFEPDQLAEIILQTKEQFKQMEEAYQASEDGIEEKKSKFASILPNFEKFQGWANEFDLADLDRRKAIASQLISSVDVSRSGITVQLNIDYQQFLGEWIDEVIPFSMTKTA